MNKFLASVAALLVASTAAAAGSSTNTPIAISAIDYGNNGIVVVNVQPALVAGKPSCAITNDPFYHYAFDAKTDPGKVMLAGLIAAHSAGEGLILFGTGDCALAGGLETLGSLRAQN